MVLDEKDKNILYALDINSRMPASKMSKLLGIRKETIIYRIHNLEKSKVLDKSLMILDLGMIGYSSYKAYISLHKTTAQKEDEIINYLVNWEKIAFITKCEGKYDIIFSLFAKNPSDFNLEFNKFLSLYQTNIHSYDTAVTLSGETYPRKFLSTTQIPKVKKAKWKGEMQKYDLDLIDKKILSILGKDGKAKLVQIAKEVKLSPDGVNLRIKKMQKQGLIQAFKIQLNKFKINYSYHKLFLNTIPLDIEKENQVFKYFEAHENIVFALKNLGKWNYELDVEAREDQKFYQILRKLKDDLLDILLTIESINCYEESKFNYYPFGFSKQ
ncbi:MAG: Lrp/AsnC family transcriptional regulator [Candidatus Micrarchaeia archaeon]|jgi:DNA-binding Lrp family transcriptional regulator